MPTKQLVFDATYANGSSTEVFDAEVLAMNASGFVPIEVFNRIESLEPEHERSESATEPLFGANLRDAIRIVREGRSLSRAEG